MVLLVSFFAAVVASSLGKPLGESFVVRNSREAVPTGFRLVGPAVSSQLLDFRVGLTSTNPSGLETTLYSISTPSNPRYGQHLNVEEV